MERRTSASIRGFTLIELLVVIAIIAILAAILFPVFASAKESGRKAACANQMSQINKGLLMYLEETNGVFPPINWGWRIGGIYHGGNPNQPLGSGRTMQIQDCLYKYVKNSAIWMCPSMKRDQRLSWEPVYASYTYADNRGELSRGAEACATNYLWNSPRYVPGKPNPYVYMNHARTSEIVRPSKAIMWYELPYKGPHLNSSGLMSKGVGGGNVAFYDGHTIFAVNNEDNYWATHSNDGWHR